MATRPKPAPSSKLPYAEVVRREVKLQLDLPCPSCGTSPSIAQIAGVIGVDGSTLWKYLHSKSRETIMLSSNMKKLVEWLKFRGVIIPPKLPQMPKEK